MNYNKHQLCALWLPTMPDYDKLTVIKLRDELVARGLPKTGLKAALVQRLIEADAQPEKSNSPTFESSKNGQQDEGVTGMAPSVPPSLRESECSDRAAVVPLQSGKQDKEKLNAADGEAKVTSLQESEKQVRAQYHKGEMQKDEHHNEQIQDSFTSTSTQVELSGRKLALAKEPELQLSTSTQTRNDVEAAEDKTEVSTQTSLTGAEILEDSRKRKRRSQSPPPSSTGNTQKRLKTRNGRPLVELPEDHRAECAEQQERPNDEQPQPNPTEFPESATQTNGHTCSKEESTRAIPSTPATIRPGAQAMPHSLTHSSPLEDLASPMERNATPTPVDGVQTPSKPSPSNTRFRNLFMSPADLEPASQTSHHLNAEEKIVRPALHPATSALYIRDLMRPLKLENLRDHLITLATPPGTAINPDIVTEFFLDSIRTHCLVGFENISAASRVRSGLHDRVWPNERDRRQLWVDFVPEEKLKTWVNVERTASSGRGHPSKRWEVVYEDEGSGIKAYLQEIGSNSGGLRAAPPAPLDAVQIVKATGYRPSAPEQRSQARRDNGNGFRALDDLFTSTAAKPKLYYLPIPKAEADRRLAKLAAGRGGGREDEMRRFSFEEGSIVDNGPEFGKAYKRGGGRSGSYRGRGRVYRVDASRAESWRERRTEYSRS